MANFEYAGNDRITGFLVDIGGYGAAQGIVAVLGAVMITLLGSSFGGFLSIILFISYYIIPEAKYGKTLGKKLVGTKVVKKNGETPGLIRSIVRNILRPIDYLLIGLILIGVTSKNQRLGDLVAGTVVIEEDSDNPNMNEQNVRDRQAPPSQNPSRYRRGQPQNRSPNN